MKRCPKCNLTISYNERWDAHFCSLCNIWLEKNCEDAGCYFCNERPTHPLPIKETNMDSKESLEKHQASPELQLFFNRLLEFKQELKTAADASDHDVLRYFYDKLHALITAGNHA